MAQPPVMTFSFDITADVAASDLKQVRINGSTGPIAVTLPAVNHGSDVGDVTTETYSGAAWTSPLLLKPGGANDKFTLSNNGVAPCKLRVGGTDITSGTYSIAISG